LAVPVLNFNKGGVYSEFRGFMFKSKVPSRPLTRESRNNPNAE